MFLSPIAILKEEIMARFNRKSAIPTAPGKGLSGAAVAASAANVAERISLRMTPFLWGRVQYLGWATMSPAEQKQFLSGVGTVKVLHGATIVRILN